MSDLLLSSTAERTYWLGRYLERAGNTARLVSVNASLMMDLPTRLPLGWLPLVDILALGESFTELYGIPLDANGEDTYEREVVRFLLSDRRHGGSLMASLSAARENARTLRSSLPRAAFEHVNAAFLDAKDALAEPLSRTRRTRGLQQTIEHLQQIDGFLSSTMLHGGDWQFLRLGNFIERADMVTRLVDLRTVSLLSPDAELDPFEAIQWRSVLNAVDAMQSYTETVQQPIEQADVLEFLLKHPQLPRSLLRSLNTIRNCLRALPKNREPLAQVDTMRRQLQRARVRSLTGERLHRWVDARQKQLYTLHNKITNTYFPPG